MFVIKDKIKDCFRESTWFLATSGNNIFWTANPEDGRIFMLYDAKYVLRAYGLLKFYSIEYAKELLSIYDFNKHNTYNKSVNATFFEF